MSATVLEQARSAHEDIERLERLIVQELKVEAKTHKEVVQRQHRVKAMLELMREYSGKLIEFYEDRDGALRDEVSALDGQFSTFYDRMKEIRDYYQRHPSAQLVRDDHLEQMFKGEPSVYFTGEEAYGRFLDLQEHYHRFVNSPFGRQIVVTAKKRNRKRKNAKEAAAAAEEGAEEEKKEWQEYRPAMDYSTYIDEFSKLQRIPRERKLGKEYADYVSGLLEYLVSFVGRSQPLQDVEKIVAKATGEFEERWKAGTVDGWEGCSSVSINLDQYQSPEELLELGADKLKEALMLLGLKAGGTPQQRAERLWLTKLYPLESIDSKHFANPAKRSKRGDDVSAAATAAWTPRDVALAEYKVRRLCEMLGSVIEETKAHVEKKQALTFMEIDKEREEAENQEEIPVEEEEEEEKEEIWNPKDLPLGFDGKPIPYWLYQLHGLNQKFTCEICGNETYRGRRAFEKHFTEAKHQHGMRCLGIPYTRVFHEVTTIDAARELWERIQEDKRARERAEEECEDREGNVYGMKVFTDLQRQGLIRL